MCAVTAVLAFDCRLASIPADISSRWSVPTVSVACSGLLSVGQASALSTLAAFDPSILHNKVQKQYALITVTRTIHVAIVVLRIAEKSLC